MGEWGSDNHMIKNFKDMTPDQLRQTIAFLRYKTAKATSRNSPYKGWLRLAQEALRDKKETPAEKFRRLIDFS